MHSANVLCLVSTKWCGTIWGLLEMAVAILNCPSYSPSSMPHNDWFHTETWIAPGNQTIQKMDRLQMIFITSMLNTPNHDVRPDSRKARAVATGLVPFSHSEEGIPLPLLHTRNGLATKTPKILVDHPGPWASTRAMPHHCDPLSFQVLWSERCWGMHRMEQPWPQSSMDSAVPPANEHWPGVTGWKLFLLLNWGVIWTPGTRRRPTNRINDPPADVHMFC